CLTTIADSATLRNSFAPVAVSHDSGAQPFGRRNVLAGMKAPKIVAACCLSVLIALYVVGAVSIPPGSLRHEVQTLALWAPIIVGFNRHYIAKWMAMPLLAFWLLIMIAIWLFLLGWARIVTGHFFPTEIAMTI